MGQNLKELFEKDRLVNHKRKADHEDLFIERLYEELPVKQKFSFSTFKIAASVILFIGLGVLSFVLINPLEQSNTDNTIVSEFTLSNISPELEEIENFYINNINQEIEFIEKNTNNDDAIKRYMKRFSILKEEYKMLNAEMNVEGPNTHSISSLINNLKLQLELLKELKTQLTKVKNNNHDII